jgi:hypothetical protein
MCRTGTGTDLFNYLLWLSLRSNALDLEGRDLLNYTETVYQLGLHYEKRKINQDFTIHYPKRIFRHICEIRTTALLECSHSGSSSASYLEPTSSPEEYGFLMTLVELLITLIQAIITALQITLFGLQQLRRIELEGTLPQEQIPGPSQRAVTPPSERTITVAPNSPSRRHGRRVPVSLVLRNFQEHGICDNVFHTLSGEPGICSVCGQTR